MHPSWYQPPSPYGPPPGYGYPSQYPLAQVGVTPGEVQWPLPLQQPREGLAGVDWTQLVVGALVASVVFIVVGRMLK